MGYSVCASAFIGVVISSPSEAQLKQVEVFCDERKEFQHTVLGHEVDDDDAAVPDHCVYVQRLEIEQWGHSAYINEHREQGLNFTEAQQKDVAELLTLIGEKPQDFRLILSLWGS
jgi:hypothetical protein